MNLERDAQCAHCRAPIAILDADAVTRALAELSAEDRRSRAPDPQAAIDALFAGQRSNRARGGERRAYDLQPAAPEWGGDVVDLVGEAIDFFMTA